MKTMKDTSERDACLGSCYDADGELSNLEQAAASAKLCGYNTCSDAKTYIAAIKSKPRMSVPNLLGYLALAFGAGVCIWAIVGLVKDHYKGVNLP